STHGCIKCLDRRSRFQLSETFSLSRPTITKWVCICTISSGAEGSMRFCGEEGALAFDHLLDEPLTRLITPSRLEPVLAKHGLHCVRDLILFAPEELEKQPGCGEGT